MTDLETIILTQFGGTAPLVLALESREVTAEMVAKALQAAYDLGHERGLGF